MKTIILKGIRAALKVAGTFHPDLAGLLAFYLFCRPFDRPRVQPAQAKVMVSAHRSKLEINGKRVEVYRWGDGTYPVLILHGWNSRAARFANMAKALSEAGYSPICFDAPAHGESSGKTTTILEYEEICRLLSREYGPFKALIGHSFGVMGLFKTLKSDVTAEKVIAISGVCDFSYLEEAFSKELELSESVRQNLRYRVERVFAPIEDIWQRFSVSYEAEKVNLPILLVYDEADNIVDPDQSVKILAAYDGKAEMYKTKGLGHRRIVADKKVIRKIVDFILIPSSTSVDDARQVGEGTRALRGSGPLTDSPRDHPVP